MTGLQMTQPDNSAPLSGTPSPPTRRRRLILTKSTEWTPDKTRKPYTRLAAKRHPYSVSNLLAEKGIPERAEVPELPEVPNYSSNDNCFQNGVQGTMDDSVVGIGHVGEIDVPEVAREPTPDSRMRTPSPPKRCRRPTLDNPTEWSTEETRNPDTRLAAKRHSDSASSLPVEKEISERAEGPEVREVPEPLLLREMQHCISSDNNYQKGFEHIVEASVSGHGQVGDIDVPELARETTPDSRVRTPSPPKRRRRPTLDDSTEWSPEKTRKPYTRLAAKRHSDSASSLPAEKEISERAKVLELQEVPEPPLSREIQHCISTDKQYQQGFEDTVEVSVSGHCHVGEIDVPEIAREPTPDSRVRTPSPPKRRRRLILDKSTALSPKKARKPHTRLAAKCHAGFASSQPAEKEVSERAEVPELAEVTGPPLHPEVQDCVASDTKYQTESQGTIEASVVGHGHVGEFEGQEPAFQLLSCIGPGKDIASAGDYGVRVVELRDVPRLRELEREFVCDHSDMFCNEPWHEQMRPLDWFDLVGVIHEESAAIQCIKSIVSLSLPGELTLKCVYSGNAEQQSGIVGYIHVAARSGVEITHLKVDKLHRGRGLEALLIGSITRAANSMGVITTGVYLGVLEQNKAAISVYRSLGFSSRQSYQKLAGSRNFEVQLMTKHLSTRSSWNAFAELCEGHARASCGRQTMKAWVASHGHAEEYDIQVQSLSQSMSPIGPGETLASIGDFRICVAELRDAPRLRELEREFVLDHSDLFCHEPWYAQMRPRDWCALVGVVHEEGLALQCIQSVVALKTAGQLTLKCVHLSRDEQQPQIIGYIHVTSRSGVEIAHLKVDKLHRGRGLGALLIASVARVAKDLGVVTAGVHLGVLQKNVPAISLYRKLGFSVRKSYETGSLSLKWQLMAKNLKTRSSWTAFAERCESHARDAFARQGGA